MCRGYNILGLDGDNGKENGNYYLGFRAAAWPCLGKQQVNIAKMLASQVETHHELMCTLLRALVKEGPGPSRE